MGAIEVLKTRRSVYQDRTVSKEIIEDIVDCAHLAPSANNLQPWEFVVVTDSGTRRQIAAMTDYGKFIADAPVCIVVFCKETKYYLEDGSAATQNVLLAAWAHGLGSCWIAGDKKPYAEEIRKLLGVPSGYRLISLLPVGYPAEHPTKEKRNLKEVLHWERF
jgi:nitroreductase